MIIYKDILTGDELISDSYDLQDIDGAVFEADCAMVDVGGVEIDIGANASAEDPDEELDDGTVKVNNIINSFRLQSTTFDKKSYLVYLKGYMKSVASKLQEMGKAPEYISQFQKSAQAYFKNSLLPNFKDFEFYTGESQDPDGMIVLLNYRSDGVTPFLIFWQHGLEGMKI